MNSYPDLMTTVQAAEYLQLKRATLDKWRVLRTGPAYVKAGSRVRYRKTDLDAWLAGKYLKDV